MIIPQTDGSSIDTDKLPDISALCEELNYETYLNLASKNIPFILFIHDCQSNKMIVSQHLNDLPTAMNILNQMNAYLNNFGYKIVNKED